jgi:hypothetical protein
LATVLISSATSIPSFFSFPTIFSRDETVRAICLKPFSLSFGAGGISPEASRNSIRNPSGNLKKNGPACPSLIRSTWKIF